MEFTNEIFFNKNLIENETVIITYSGKLYREHSGEIYIVYGFGDNWEYTSEAPMKEIENGFEVTIDLKEYNTFNFCFKNNYNIWDNNFGFNYIAPIAKKPQTPISNQENENTSDTISTSSNIVETEEENTDNTTNSESSNEVSTDESADKSSKASILEDNEIENIFASLLDSILDVKPFEHIESTNFENGFGLQSVENVNEESTTESKEETSSNADAIETKEVDLADATTADVKENNFVDCDKIFKEYYDELSSAPDTTIGELDNLFDKTFDAPPLDENKDIEITPNTDITDLKANNNLTKNNETELDELMDNILNSIETKKSNSETANSEATNIELVSPIQNNSTNPTTSDLEEKDIELASINERYINETAETNTDSDKNTLELDKITFEDVTENINTPIENSNLPIIHDEEDLFDKFIDASYNFIVKVGSACKKLGKLIKLKAQEYGIIKNK